MFRFAVVLWTVPLGILIHTAIPAQASSTYTECSCVCTNTSIQATTKTFEKVATTSGKDSTAPAFDDSDSAALHTSTTAMPTTSQDSTSPVLDPFTSTSAPGCATESRLSASTSPESCSEVCNDVINGLIPDIPIGFASHGAEAEIFPDFLGGERVRVYCDCTNGSEEAWTVFQRRMDNSVTFYRNWTDYVNGFGNVSGEFWLGLKWLHNFTRSGEYELRCDLADFSDTKDYAQYSSFSVGNSSNNYNLSFGGELTGGAGDGLGVVEHSSDANGMPFTTRDRDNDNDARNCAEIFKGAWWFNGCFGAHLNGEYVERGQTPTSTGEGIIWSTWRGYDASLQRVEMKFRMK